ncbi:MAG: tRNA dihydrouridine synthase DusB [Alphaproteobacteria bacterium]|nr:tRNA dihydrouridine synthase DusB [Alphaproteobacteria bacterium]
MTSALLKIGNLSVSPVIGAPMAGVTDAPFRRIVRRFGKELLHTEMVLAASLVHAHKQTRQMALCEETDAPVAVQLEGTKPDVMAEAARIVEKTKRAQLIDINMGCPVAKIVKAGGGAALMNTPELAESIVRAVVTAVRLPVTVKFRSGWDEDSLTYSDFGKRMRDAGATAVTLHARTRTQFYSGKADWGAVAELKRALDIPVIANGDVRTPEQAKQCLSETGADGVMIGRGLLGKPWVLAECSAFLNGGKPPVVDDLGALALDHFDEMEKYYGHKAVFIARKHIAWYSLGLTGSAAFRRLINETDEPEAMRALIRDFFGGKHDESK